MTAEHIKKGIELLNTLEWLRDDHAHEGATCMAFPYNRYDAVAYAWIMGPMDRYVADWLMDAIKLKQQKEAEKVKVNRFRKKTSRENCRRRNQLVADVGE